MLNKHIFLPALLFSMFLSAQSTVDSLIKNTEKKADSIITNGIKNQAFPGANVLVAHKDSVVFHKTYGFHTYDSLVPVQPDDLYDLASVTKITGPLPALMKLVDEEKLDLDAPFSTYWATWQKRKDKKDLTLREILAHQAGLEPYIVFLQKVQKKNGRLKRRFVRSQPSERFNKQAYDTLFVHPRFEKKLVRTITRSKVSEEKTYRYSGLTFLLFPKVIEALSGLPYATYLRDNFYGPMGLNTLTYTPISNGFSGPIVPTEIDTIFRRQLVKGWVHDENAALLGGVSGNAGLFGTAADLGKLMQLYANYGELDGRRYINRSVIKAFTAVQYPDNENRRGLGFDKPLLGNDTLNLEQAYPAPSASPSSFGHSGFTGTFVWADPEEQLVFIFLSNRVYPYRSHRELYALKIRETLQQVFYEALAD